MRVTPCGAFVAVCVTVAVISAHRTPGLRGYASGLCVSGNSAASRP